VTFRPPIQYCRYFRRDLREMARGPDGRPPILPFGPGHMTGHAPSAAIKQMVE
jgi:hypothetical protein